jgi:hypothetical protein
MTAVQRVDISRRAAELPLRIFLRLCVDRLATRLVTRPFDLRLPACAADGRAEALRYLRGANDALRLFRLVTRPFDWRLATVWPCDYLQTPDPESRIASPGVATNSQ